MVEDAPARRRQTPIKVRPLPDERADLEARAAAAGMPLSAYLLAAGLDRPLAAPPPESPAVLAGRPEAGRRAQAPVKVRPLPAERDALTTNAAAAGMPLSAYLLAAGLGQTVKSVVDLRQIEVLAQINADQGRLGGLLKLWLSKEARLAPGNPGRHEITALLDSIRETQNLLKTAAKALVERV